MKMYKALALLDEGRCVRHKNWCPDAYAFKHTDGYIRKGKSSHKLILEGQATNCLFEEGWEEWFPTKTFGEVFEHFMVGGKIRRRSWAPGTYLIKGNSILMSSSILEADDWEIVV